MNKNQALTAMHHVKTADFEIKYGDVMLKGSLNSVLKTMIEQAARVGLTVLPDELEKQGRNSWVGTSSAFMDFFGANSLRFKEMRTGVSQVQIGTVAGANGVQRAKMVNIAEYGFGIELHSFCEMITFPPEKHGSMA